MRDVIRWFKCKLKPPKNYAVKASFLVKRLQILFSGFKKTKSNVYHLDLKRWKPNFLNKQISKHVIHVEIRKIFSIVSLTFYVKYCEIFPLSLLEQMSFDTIYNI